MYTLLRSLPLQRFDTGAASPQAAALRAREAVSVPSVAELTPDMPPLPLAVPGPDAAPAITIEADTTEGDQ